MSDLPWRTERVLDAATVGRIVGAQFPGLVAARTCLLAEGWDMEAYLVDETWIFKFPKRASVAGTLEVERALLPVLAPILPVPIPAPTLHGTPCAEFPWPFLGYSMLLGTPASQSSHPARAGHAATMGRFLGALHGFPADEARALGVPVAATRSSGGLLDRARGWWPTISRVVPPVLARRTESFLAAPPPPPDVASPRLIHYDLRPDHVLLSDEEGTISGVIDWGDLSIGDPAYDVAGLWMWGGESFVKQALSHDEGSLDPGVAVRARHRAAMASLSLLWWAVRGDRAQDVAPALAQLGRAVLP